MAAATANILYIEDEFFFSDTISRKLEDVGFKVTVAGDGEQGLNEALTTHYDLILLDLILPKMGGFDVLKHLKEDDKTKHVPVIILSNLSSDENKQKGESLGVVQFFVKVNSEPKDIVQAVNKLFTDKTVSPARK